MKAQLSAIAAVAASALLLSGCSVLTSLLPGAVPSASAPAGGAPNVAPTAIPTPAPTGTPDPNAGFDPCSYLTEAQASEAAGFQLGAGVPKTLDDSKVTGFTASLEVTREGCTYSSGTHSIYVEFVKFEEGYNMNQHLGLAWSILKNLAHDADFPTIEDTKAIHLVRGNQDVLEFHKAQIGVQVLATNLSSGAALNAAKSIAAAIK